MECQPHAARRRRRELSHRSLRRRPRSAPGTRLPTRLLQRPAARARTRARHCRPGRAGWSPPVSVPNADGQEEAAPASPSRRACRAPAGPTGCIHARAAGLRRVGPVPGYKTLRSRSALRLRPSSVPSGRRDRSIRRTSERARDRARSLNTGTRPRRPVRRSASPRSPGKPHRCASVRPGGRRSGGIAVDGSGEVAFGRSGTGVA